MSQPRQRTLLGVTVGHAAHDTWFGVAPVLLASLSIPLQLSNSDIGLILLLYQVLSSVMQPFFGRLSERIGGRPLAVASILWTTTFYSGALFAPSKVVLAVLIFLAGLGSGAWHPQGAANATRSGGSRWGATAASVFFQGGTLGSALLGAALGGYLLSVYGPRSLLVLSVISATLALTVVRRAVPRWLTPAEKSEPTQRASNGPAASVFWLLFAFLLLATALRALTYHSLNSYIPKFQQDQGVSPAVYGLLMSGFMVATAIGGLAGSYLADRVGIRGILVPSLAIGAALFVLFLHVPGGWSYVWFIFSGLFIGPSHTLFVVVGQKQFPQRMAMISGLFLGFTFVSGAIGTWLLGLLADKIGLVAALGVLPWALFAAALCSLIAVPRVRAAAVREKESPATA